MAKLLLKAVTGSTAYNLNTSGSDVDYRGVYLDPPESVFGLNKSETEYMDNRDDVIYGFKHFMSMVSKGNPNITELLFLKPEHYLVLDGRFKANVLNNKNKFLTKSVVRSYRGCITGLIKSTEKDGRPAYSHNFMDCKSAMHAIRLLYQLKDVVVGQPPQVYLSEKERELLLSIKAGQAFKDFEEFYLYAEDLQSTIKGLELNTHIPENLDSVWLNSTMKKLFEESFYAEPNVYR